MKTLMNHLPTRFFVAVLTLSFVPACVTYVLAQDESHEHRMSRDRLAQVVALDECDPTTFNVVLGADFCKNVALGYSTTLTDLFQEAANGTPDPKWSEIPIS